MNGARWVRVPGLASIGPRAIVSLAVVVMAICGGLRSVPASADLSDELDDGYAFSTAAIGLVETGGDDLSIVSDRESLDEDETIGDPGFENVGFIIVAEGEVLISEEEEGPVAILEQGQALFVPQGSRFGVTAIGDDATIWRISIASSDDEDDLPDEADVVVPGDSEADDDAVRVISFRTGTVPEGLTAAMGGEDETVPLVYAIEGDAELDGDDLDEGDDTETESNDVSAESDPAFVGFLVVGPARSVDGGEAEPTPTEPVVEVPDEGSNPAPDPGNDDQPEEPPVEEPEPTATATPTEEPPPVDTDSDGLSDADEALLGTDPNNHDSDLDGIPDGREVNSLGTNPLDTDTDSDGLTDGLEIDHCADPNVPDTDGDGLGDAFEANSGFSEPCLADTDGDGDDDLAEFSLGTDPRDPNCFSGPGSVCQ